MKKIKTCTLVLLIALLMASCSNKSNESLSKTAQRPHEFEQVRAAVFSPEAFATNSDVIELKAEGERRKALLNELYKGLGIKDKENRLNAFRKVLNTNEDLKASLNRSNNYIKNIVATFASLRDLSKSDLKNVLAGRELENNIYRKTSYTITQIALVTTIHT